MQTPDRPKLLGRFIDDNKKLLERYDPDEAIKLLDSVPLDKHYHFIPAKLEQLWSAVIHEFGDEGFDSFQSISMLRMIERFEVRAASMRYTPTIRSCFDSSFNRITMSIADSSFDKYRSTNDILLKDLAICRQRLFPAGARVIDPHSGFHRFLVHKGGMLQALQALGLLFRTGGNKPFYMTHTHLSELEEFNPKGWDLCCMRVAEMLELNPEIKGLWGGSWFYDPALQNISPRLSYLRERPLQGGASLFYSNVSLDGGALSKSKTRRKLYEQGKYIPKAYAFIWPRRSLIAWAKKFKNSASTFQSAPSK